jgi:beta-lactamase class A/beta-lactamase class A VEB
MLAQIDKGKFALDQKITITKAEMHPDLYSPIRDKYPEGCTLTIGEIMGYTVSSSDNVGCDVLIRLLGGTARIERYFKKNKFKNIAIKTTEVAQQADWNIQFQNWTTPHATNEVLNAFWNNKRGKKTLLSQQSYDFLWKVMRETSTGKNRIVNQLPKQTIVAHKTGTSGSKNGRTEAVNDMGVVILPNGERFFISVFVSASLENNETNEKIIADIAKAAWDYFVQKP